MFFLHLTSLRIFFSFINLTLTIGVQWNLTLLAYLWRILIIGMWSPGVIAPCQCTPSVFLPRILLRRPHTTPLLVLPPSSFLVTPATLSATPHIIAAWPTPCSIWHSLTWMSLMWFSRSISTCMFQESHTWLFAVPVRIVSPSNSRVEISVRGEACDTPSVTIAATVPQLYPWHASTMKEWNICVVQFEFQIQTLFLVFKSTHINTWIWTSISCIHVCPNKFTSMEIKWR
jgi:hypothetical protein